MIGLPEIGWILIVILVVIFGSSKLPQIGKGLGEAIRNFKKAVSEQKEIDVTPKKNTEGEKTGSDKESKT